MQHMTQEWQKTRFLKPFGKVNNSGKLFALRTFRLTFLSFDCTHLKCCAKMWHWIWFIALIYQCEMYNIHFCDNLYCLYFHRSMYSLSDLALQQSCCKFRETVIICVLIWHYINSYWYSSLCRIKKKIAYKMLGSVLLLAVFSSLSYAFYKWATLYNDFFEKRHIKHKPPRFFFGNARGLSRDKYTAIDFAQKLYKSFSDES